MDSLAVTLLIAVLGIAAAAAVAVRQRRRRRSPVPQSEEILIRPVGNTIPRGAGISERPAETTELASGETLQNRSAVPAQPLFGAREPLEDSDAAFAGGPEIAQVSETAMPATPRDDEAAAVSLVAAAPAAPVAEAMPSAVPLQPTDASDAEDSANAEQVLADRLTAEPAMPTTVGEIPGTLTTALIADNAAMTEAGTALVSHPPYSEEAPLEGLASSASAGTSEVAAVVAKLPQRRPPSQYRDQRGRKRRQRPEPDSEAKPAQESLPAAAAQRAPAEARLRLLLHPIHQTAQLSLILTRPAGFPASATIVLAEPVTVEAYSDSRYDDVDIDWQSDTLSGELRYSSVDGFRWTRSARRIHLFASDPAETGLISVSAARIGREYTVICTRADAPLVASIVATTGSPAPRSHDHWRGIPAGWTVLTGFSPARAAEPISDPSLKSLDPGFDMTIELTGGLALRANAFAEGHPPNIGIDPVPDGVSVLIDGQSAWRSASGSWQSTNWNRPGNHLVDVVPGPSLTYEIVPDPANGAGWSVFSAHEQRFSKDGPWARAQICGASIFGPSGEAVIAHEACQTLIALGTSDHAVQLRRRPDADVSVGLLPLPPAFLLVSSGSRRHQGEIVWLGLEPANANTRRAVSSFWAGTVRLAVARRLPLRTCGGDEAKDLWQKAKRRARSLRRRSS